MTRIQVRTLQRLRFGKSLDVMFERHPRFAKSLAIMREKHWLNENNELTDLGRHALMVHASNLEHLRMRRDW